MNELPSSSSASAEDAVDRICEAFERAWQDGAKPRLEDYLGQVTEDRRARLWRELLLAELECRRRQGETPSADEYRQRFPDRHDAVAQLFAGGAAAAGTRAETSEAPPAHLPMGTRVGPYKLLEQIGEGGMGTVWVAEQQQPVRRKVALKLIKPGMDSRQVIARFEAERQALALMDHPNIAKVLDAGTTGPNPKSEIRNPKQTRSTKSQDQKQAEGQVSDIGASDLGFVSDFGFRDSDFGSSRPYFVMELVKGVPITKYCDEHRLTPRQRLELFIPVCQAIQHAHHKGIIHRDLKPSNVLIALYDDRPVAKVIDFGVAKATGTPLTAQTLHTGFGAVVGTVEYMSPEQASFNQLDVDTRSDIYSLGVLLYELLAGSPPFSRKEMETAGMLETLRMIREQEPPTPSTRLSTADGLPTLAANRGTEPKRLTALVRGELDWIVMKALEKDRSRRYETANGLAMDLERYLADEPVLACPPSAGYRLRKWASRHRTVVWAVVLLVSVVLLAFAAVTWQWRVAVQALADKELAREAEAEQRDKTEANWAAGLIALADRDWVRGDLIQARRSLELCPVKYRNDEWRRLHVLCHAEIASTTLPVAVRGLVPRFSPDGRGFVVVGTTEIVWFDAHDGRATVLCDTPIPEGVVGSALGANGAELTVTLHKNFIYAQEGGIPQRDHSVGVWDPRAKRWLARLQLEFGPRGNLSPDGRLIALADDKEVQIREVSTGKALRVLPIPNAAVHCFSPDGQRLAVAWQKGIRLWDVATGALAQEIPGQRNLVFSPDGQYLSFYTYPKPGKIVTTVWSIRQGGVVANLDIGDIACKAFSPDGRFLAVGVSGGMIELWDFVQSRCVVTFRGHTPDKTMTAVSFSPNGRRLVSGGADGMIKVWNLGPLYEHLEKSNGR